MIIDYDESRRTGRVMTLAARGQFSAAVDEMVRPAADDEKLVEKTLAFAAVKPVQPVSTTPTDDKPRPPLDPPWKTNGFREDIARSEVLEYRPRYETTRETVTGRFVPAGPCAGLTLYGKRKDPEQNEREPEGVVQVKTSADTGTHALPAVEKITGKPSTAAELHRLARQVQNSKRHLGVSVWYGEYTKEFWVMNEWGLHPFESVTAMNQGMGW